MKYPKDLVSLHPYDTTTISKAISFYETLVNLHRYAGKNDEIAYVTVDVDGHVYLWPEWGCRPILTAKGLWEYPWYYKGIAPEPILFSADSLTDMYRTYVQKSLLEALSQCGIPVNGAHALFAERPVPWVGFDLDGTLATQLKVYDPTGIGEVIESMKAVLMDTLKDNTFKVRILTARLDPCTPHAHKACEAILKWTMEQFGTKIWPTSTKDSHMVLLYDDRCYRV